MNKKQKVLIVLWMFLTLLAGAYVTRSQLRGGGYYVSHPYVAGDEPNFSSFHRYIPTGVIFTAWMTTSLLLAGGMALGTRRG